MHQPIVLETRPGSYLRTTIDYLFDVSLSAGDAGNMEPLVYFKMESQLQNLLQEPQYWDKWTMESNRLF